MAAEAKVLNKSVVRIGDLLWAGADMTLGPMDATAFPALLSRLVEADIPFRISFLIEGGGIYATQMRTFLATLMGATNAANKQIKYSLEGLQTMARNEPVVRFRCSFAPEAKGFAIIGCHQFAVTSIAIADTGLGDGISPASFKKASNAA